MVLKNRENKNSFHHIKDNYGEKVKNAKTLKLHQIQNKSNNKQKRRPKSHLDDFETASFIYLFFNCC